MEKKFGIFSSIASLNSSSPFSKLFKEADRFKISFEEFSSENNGLSSAVFDTGASSDSDVSFTCGWVERDMAERERGLSFSGELSESVRLLDEAVGEYLSETEYDLESYKTFHSITSMTSFVKNGLLNTHTFPYYIFEDTI